MNAYEFEKAAFEWGRNEFKYPKGNFLKKGFAPNSIGVADFSIIEKDGEYHLFHIERRMDGFPLYPGNEIYFGHASTKDFIRWEVHHPVNFISPGEWDCEHVWAPYILKWQEKFYMFYTGVNEFGAQAIGVSVSNDLFEWKKYKRNPVFKPDNWAYWHYDKPSPCRDTHIYFENDKFYMLYTASSKTGETCIGMAVSDNLFNWKDVGAIYKVSRNYNYPYKGKLPAHTESSCLHKIDNNYYLFVGINGGVRLFVSKVINKFEGSGKLIIPNQTSLEVVKRIDEKDVWIVATFGLYDNRLYIYYLDFNYKIPRAKRISDSKVINGN